ncbi:Nicotinate phosphoribosyltransferase pncB2 [Candidatus Xiphinematobacter sp. Idaho Grape]|uniref:nicotinate phosphoribosyltransferase n=1 Tax=Candidatus Xiphinematobacter sp. Idaho Grape TaxID=1704307 RepID=UPI0007064331|nr:nicotinate phosphoribosyltransferase [Candidatus Xiphinematobacter sp. Idaho Grape]ALJ56410.1 Nicotinate phosphoribosyltransferase pncB2 [Candidatus Xiphinematobacter sp. Idaho Grape]
MKRVECGSHSLLLTDLYELTMAYGYWKHRIHEREAVFHLSFRRNPFRGNYSVACGLADAVDHLRHLSIDGAQCCYLQSLVGNDKRPLFEKDFLDYLRKMNFSCDVDAVPEGTIVFPHEPVLRVRGPILQAQILETVLLNLIASQSLIATKAARICLAAEGDPVIEFGLRHAQGINGGMAATRAAYIGGCVATSNVLAGMHYDIPVKGTQAHSWVMAFETEREAFQAYAEAIPNNCVFLVDTYNTLEGVRNAVWMAQRLREQGHAAVGIRLDSGDLAYFSTEAQKILDQAGCADMAIIASNELDENIIARLKRQRVPIHVWCIGTKLVSGYDQPALGSVYKLGAIKKQDGTWRPCIKISEHLEKMSIPGILQVRRFQMGREFVGDMIYDETILKASEHIIVDPTDTTRTRLMPVNAIISDLLVPIFRKGKQVYQDVGIQAIRRRVREQLQCLHPDLKQPFDPYEYPVGMELNLHRQRTDSFTSMRGVNHHLAP